MRPVSDAPGLALLKRGFAVASLTQTGGRIPYSVTERRRLGLSDDLTEALGLPKRRWGLLVEQIPPPWVFSIAKP